jgi:hypothetical protein
MRFSFYAAVLALSTCAPLRLAVAADIPVVVVSGSSLPYSQSPSNYDNSPSNFGNSVSNFQNSPSNFDNSESNFSNSPANQENSISGKRRLMYSKGGDLMFVGYYVVAKNGTTNFFSQRGRRMFYNPKKGVGIFGSEDGTFCGVLVRIKDQLSFVLTEDGAKALFLAQ